MSGSPACTRSSSARRTPSRRPPARWPSSQLDRARAGLEAVERLLPGDVRPPVADAPPGGLVRRRVERAEAALVGRAVERRFEEGVLEPLPVLVEQRQHAALSLLAADRSRVLGPLDLALVVGGGRRVDEPRLPPGADVDRRVRARAVEQREVL